MGGNGSGRGTRYGAKLTVERCRGLDVNWMARQRMLWAWHDGAVNWIDADGKQTSSVGYSILPAENDDELRLVLSYRWNDQESISLPIRLVTTYPHLGGVRWWFICPLIVGGVTCGRRVGKLYLRGRYFGCRHCHGLTYRSSQEAHSRDRLPARLDRMEAWITREAGKLKGRPG